MFEKEAEEYALEKCKECYMCHSEENGERGYCPKLESRKEGYIAGAEPREKRIEELEKENKVLAQNLEDTEILNKTYEKKNKELKTDYEVLSCSVGDFGELQNKLEEEQRKNNGFSDNLTTAKEIICEYVRLANLEKEDTVAIWQLYHKAEQFLKDCKVEK